MTKNEEQILEIIIAYYNENKVMPSFRYLQKEMSYKSVNSVRQYIKSLEKKGYLIRNFSNNIVINNTNNIHYFRQVKIINAENEFINIALNKRKNYLAYKLKNNFFKDFGILKNDILIIEKKNHLKNGEIGLFIIDNKPRIMIYDYKDGFFILKDNETIILNKVKILGKLVNIERRIEKL